MRAYKVPVVINSAVPIDHAYFFTDNVLADGESHYIPIDGTYNFDNASEILRQFDYAVGSSIWRKAPQALYNRYTGSQYMLETVYPLIETYWGSSTSFTPLPNVYSTNTTIAPNVTISNKVISGSSSTTSILSGGIDTTIGSNSPIGYTIKGNSPTVTIIFTVFPDDAVTDGKITLNTDMYYVTFVCEILMTRPGEWNLRAYTFSILHVPESWVSDLNGASADSVDDDPYSDDTPDSDSGGGDGDQDNWEDGDSNPEPGLPSVQATDAGFITLFAPTIGQIKTLAQYMWSNLFDLDTYKKLFADPMDCILGLSLVPANVIGAAGTVTVGNISTGVSMNKASSQYKRFDCGSISIHEKLKSYLDYSPYRKVYLFLPYIGTKQLDIDMLNGESLKITYHVDVLTGGCTAYVIVDNNVIDTYAGQCSMNVPVTSRDWSSTIQGICTLAASAAGAVASGGLTAPVQAAEIAGMATSAANVAGNVMNSKPSYEHSGGLGSSPGILGMQKPYLILERPRLCKPSNQNKYTGYPAYITRTLSSLSGFTQVQDIRIKDISATETERDEILRLLRTGVIL